MESMSESILVVEDEENLRLLYEAELSDEGYQVILARNGKEAIEAIERSLIDLIVLDIVMPVMDGMEALERLIGQHKNIPVILHTSHPHYKDDFMSWGADAYLIKSSELTELKATVRRLLETKASSLKEVHCYDLSAKQGQL